MKFNQKRSNVYAINEKGQQLQKQRPTVCI